MRVAVCLLSIALVLSVGAAAAEREAFYVRTPMQVERMVSKVIRKQITEEREAAKERGEDTKDYKFSGFQEGSPLRQRAEAEAAERGTLRPRTHSSELAPALLPQLDSNVVLAIGAGPTGEPQLLGSPDGDTDGSDGDGEAGDTGSQLAIPAHQVAAYKESVKLVDDVSAGAIANTGALPRDANQWMTMAEDSLSRKPLLRHHDVHWLLATAELEHNDTEALSDGEEERAATEKLEEEMAAWFAGNGGKMTYAEVDANSTVLRATEALNDGELVLTMPLKLTLSQVSARNVRLKGGYLGQHLKKLFDKSQRWGLAMMLLHEHFKDTTGRGSKWAPFLRTLRVAALTKPVMREIRGTYASQTFMRWEDDADSLGQWVDREHFCLHHDMCARKKDSIPSSFSRSDIRWAMWVVRRFGMYVTKKTTGKPFLALVPYSHLLLHKRGGGGGVQLEMDNTVRVYAGASMVGEAIGIDMGAIGDAEHFLRFHTVPEEDNEDNHVLLSLPGRGGSSSDMFEQLDALRRWRKELGLPPRMSDLWRVTDSLHLFGDDEEEQKLLSRSNTKIAGLPLPTDQVTAEEQLMLYNGLDMSQAQLMVTEVEGEPGAQLYAAPDPEDDDRAKDAMDDLAAAVLQLQRAVSVGPVDNATLTVINKTRNFLEHGVMPWKGLDEVDQLLLRKLSVLTQCGSVQSQRINHANVSAHLLCAMRVHLVNQTDLDIVCPKADGPWFEPKCEDDSFNWTLPISLDNEVATLNALEGSIKVLLAGYTTSIEEDEALLEGTSAEGGNGMGPTVRAAVVMRLREKQLLERALDDVSALRGKLDNYTYQALIQETVLEDKAKRRAAQQAHMDRLLKEAQAKVISVSFQVTIDDGRQANLTVYERDMAEQVVAAFIRNHSLPATSYQTLLNNVMDRGRPAPPLLLAMRVFTPDGMRRVLSIHEGQNATDEALRFCMMYNITEESGARERVINSAVEQLEQRMKRKVLVTVPVTGLDARRLQLQVRQGEQHILYETVLDFCLAYGMPENVVMNLAQEVNRRLPNVLLEMPVHAQGQVPLQMRVSVGDERILEEVVKAFCEVHGLPESNVPVLLRRVRSSLHPGALVL